MSVLLYSVTTWTLKKCLVKKLAGNYTKMLCTVLNKSWKQQPPTKQQVYSYYLPSHKPSQ